MKSKLGKWICLGVLIILGIYIIGVYNTLNQKSQTALGGNSSYSSALNVCSQKMKGLWTMADQATTKDTEAQKGVAAARSGFDNAMELFKTAQAQNKTLEEQTKAAAGALQSALNVRVQIEAYPTFTSMSTYQEAMRGVQEGTNEIKTALDDWIVTIKDYNIYRNSFFPGIVGKIFPKFPKQYKYYEGQIKELNMEDLNPVKK